MELYGYSDHESQAIHLGPLLTSGCSATPGDLETQPLFLELEFLVLIPDACTTLDIGPDAIALMRIRQDAQLQFDMPVDAATTFSYIDYGSADLDLRPNAAATIHLKQDADIMLNMQNQAALDVSLPADGQRALELPGDAAAVLDPRLDAGQELNIPPDADTVLDVEACDE